MKKKEKKPQTSDRTVTIRVEGEARASVAALLGEDRDLEDGDEDKAIEKLEEIIGGSEGPMVFDEARVMVSLEV